MEKKKIDGKLMIIFMAMIFRGGMSGDSGRYIGTGGICLNDEKTKQQGSGSFNI